MMIYVLALTLVLLAVVSLLALSLSPGRAVITAVITPLLLFNLGFGWYTIDGLRGHPRHDTMPEDSELLWAALAKPEILLLVREPGQALPVYRAVPWNETLAEDLAQALQGQKSGQKFMLRPGSSESSGERSPGPRYEVYQFRHEDAMPKDRAR